MKIAVFLFWSMFLFPFSADCQETQSACLLVTQLQEPSALSSQKEISKLINLSKKSGVKFIFIQVYRANKAWFPSRNADMSPYHSCFKSSAEDPLQLLIEQAHLKDIKVCAWFNLVSLNNNSSAPILKKYGLDILTRNLKEKKKVGDYKIDNQYFLEPGDLRVRKELVSVVEEVLQSYPELDGILFDYIRYPDVHPDYGYTKTNMERFRNKTGLQKIDKDSLAWKDWKRRQVTELLGILVKKARTIRPGIQVGATGCAPYVRAYYEAYQDWPSWIRDNFVDFVFLMSYPDDIKEFNKNIQDAKKRVGDFKKIYIGLPAYKLVHLAEVFRQELQAVKASGAGGYGIFHYASLLENPDFIRILKEVKRN
jgi:uncharacterized lipoprotein YddW (UPF0748 family)